MSLHLFSQPCTHIFPFGYFIRGIPTDYGSINTQSKTYLLRLKSRLEVLSCKDLFLLFIQEEELHYNVTAGIVLSDHSLVLQSITRESGGRYTCMAVNVEGRASSNAVNLQVMCKYISRSFGVTNEKKISEAHR